MRLKLLFLLLLCSCFILSGCSGKLSPENQAYVLILGVDIKDNGMTELTIQIPKTGSSGSSSDSEKKDTSYLTISASGSNYQDALESLKWSATRELNLSQIKMIVISEKVSRSASFSPIVSTIAETYHLYTAARFVICQGSAREFINGHETILGIRLTDELDAMFDHYSELGYIPRGNFTDIYFGMNTFYSDSMCIWGFSSSEEDTSAKPASAMLGSDKFLKEQTQTPSSRHYLGSVIIKNGVFAEKLDASHTLIVNLINGNLEAFNYECNGQVYQLTPLEKPRTHVTFHDNTAHISIKIRLSAIAQNSSLERNEVAPIIENDIMNTIRYCQSKEIEPFGFAEKAACNFLTIDEWLEVDWHSLFSNANATVEVNVMRADI